MINRVAGPVGSPNLAEHIKGRLTQRLSGSERDQNRQPLAGTQDNRFDRIGIISHLFTLFAGERLSNITLKQQKVQTNKKAEQNQLLRFTY